MITREGELSCQFLSWEEEKISKNTWNLAFLTTLAWLGSWFLPFRVRRLP